MPAVRADTIAAVVRCRSTVSSPINVRSRSQASARTSRGKSGGSLMRVPGQDFCVRNATRSARSCGLIVWPKVVGITFWKPGGT